MKTNKSAHFFTIFFMVLTLICALSIISLGDVIDKLYVGMIMFSVYSLSGFIYIGLCEMG